MGFNLSSRAITDLSCWATRENSGQAGLNNHPDQDQSPGHQAAGYKADPYKIVNSALMWWQPPSDHATACPTQDRAQKE